ESRRPLQQQQVFLTALLENVEDGIVACDARGVLTLFNRAAREFHGLPEQAIPADQWAEYYDLYLPDGKTRMSKEDIPLFRALQGEHVRNVEMVIAPKRGAARTLLAGGRALFGPDGDKLGAVVVMHDITERKRAQDDLKRESNLMQALMDNITDAIYFKDGEGRFTRVNRHAPYRSNASPEEVVGKTDFDFFAEEHARAAYEDEQRIMRTGRPVIDKEEKETYPDGSATWLSTTKVPTFDEAGRVTGIVGISRDITERKRAEEERIQLIREQAARAEAEAANRLKDEFLATVSHELRTPLTAIIGWAQMLRAGRLDEDSAARALETIERQGKLQAQLIDDLLDVSRIITGKLRLDAQRVELALTIEAVMNAVGPAAAAKNIRLQKALDPQAGPVLGDPDRLQQVVWNLLSNAVKFTPKGGRVDVRLERINSHVQIIVSDTGDGIPTEFLPQVFAPFRQADGSTTRTQGGLGLGLSIVRHLVELHGGTVQAESRGEGQGATFTVRLPVMAVYEQHGVVDASASHGHDRFEGLEGLKVLVVDDDADTRELLKAVLGSRGVEVSAAGSAQEALELIERLRPAVLVSDIGMPGEDGYDLIRKVRALPAERGGRTPAVALTAYASAEDRARAFLAGYQVHIPKPIEPSELMGVVASLAGGATVAS
ncbi:MAG: PAS domain S-box protein, partial [Acidobacteriota bacterium]|nr:PAS domain S-box protein [Acidobacteriota bacterium]